MRKSLFTSELVSFHASWWEREIDRILENDSNVIIFIVVIPDDYYSMCVPV